MSLIDQHEWAKGLFKRSDRPTRIERLPGSWKFTTKPIRARRYRRLRQGLGRDGDGDRARRPIAFHVAVRGNHYLHGGPPYVLPALLELCIPLKAAAFPLGEAEPAKVSPPAMAAPRKKRPFDILIT